ncbi:acyl-CoA synthetase [Dictyobacter alpinus]|uniref:Acyl-CoA synthetase n=1 Tax=Dictyobacter alpinus TaxID=2014873 RepID=A0A402BIU5_9CHLR|nr:fatty acyl-AMP ligase [Dictyobacter alpinus]GCE31285.1 acyl-CoA synthetase [Dictyobacter alpinus]
MSIYLADQINKVSTLVDLLHERAHNTPDRRAYNFLRQGEKEEGHFSYAELDQRARALGSFLQSKKVKGKPVLLLHAPGLDYITGFFGCLYAQAIAVPAYPPASARMMPRIQSIVADTQAEIILTTSDLVGNLRTWFQNIQALQHVEFITTDNLPLNRADEWHRPDIHGDTLAFLQYTSGSTSTPKGVMVSHGNLVYNLSMLHECCGQHDDSHLVSWLPPYHDMGLIAGILLPLYGGCPSTIMSPLAFLQRPLRWLQAMSNYRATESFGPNFAFELCSRKATPEMIESLDLSNWEVAANGAEPVREDTMKRFIETFTPSGLRPNVFFPGYGMAETTLMAATGSHIDAPILLPVRKAALQEGRVEVDLERNAECVNVVGYQRTPIDQKTIIVNPETLLQCAPDQIGEIWIGGRSVAQGYWQNPEESERTFRARLADSGEGPFLRTGDLGFVYENVFFITGRLKDLIIIRGLNHYPQDIEAVAEKSHYALRPGCSAAFATEIQGKEQLVVVAEVHPRYIPDIVQDVTATGQQDAPKNDRDVVRQPIDPEEIYTSIRRAVAEEQELQIAHIQLLKAGHMFKTSSGKVQRRACKAAFLANSLNKWNE